MGTLYLLKYEIRQNQDLSVELMIEWYSDLFCTRTTDPLIKMVSSLISYLVLENNGTFSPENEPLQGH